MDTGAGYLIMGLNRNRTFGKHAKLLQKFRSWFYRICFSKYIYDSANRNLSRQRSLQGGYSPGFGAASAKMARESSDLISQRTTDASAGIADMVQRGKLAGATALAPFEARENELRNQINASNAAEINRTNMFNTQAGLDFGQFNRQGEQFNKQLDLSREQFGQTANQNDFNNILQSIQGQQSLYGTTPGLANTFGNQALNAAQTVNNLPPIQRGFGNYGGYGGRSSNITPGVFDNRNRTPIPPNFQFGS